jgi:hypothetical protein
MGRIAAKVKVLVIVSDIPVVANIHANHPHIVHSIFLVFCGESIVVVESKAIPVCLKGIRPLGTFTKWIALLKANELVNIEETVKEHSSDLAGGERAKISSQ